MTDRVSPVRLFAAVVVGLALLAPLGLALAALSGSGHRWIDILTQFTGQALVMAVVGLVAAILLRARAVIVAAVVVCGLVLAAGWSQWATPRGEPEPGSPGFTVYSANLQARNTDVEAMAASIAAANADILILVEFGDAPQAAIDSVLAGYPYRAANQRMDRPNGAVRSVIASRWPLQGFDLHIRSLNAIGAVAETPLGPVTLAAAHFTRPWPYQVQWEQIRQAEGLAAWASSADRPMIVAGDFNSVSNGRIGRLIQSEGGVLPAPGWPGTWPASLPAVAGMTIDQVYRTPELALVDRRVGQETGSDHRPVITRFVRAVPPAA